MKVEDRTSRFREVERLMLAILTVVLIVSIALNVFLYSENQRLSQWHTTGERAFITESIQAGMGEIIVTIHDGLYYPRGREFNSTVGIRIFDPIIASRNYTFNFSLYQRPLDGEYPLSPVAGKTATVEKPKDALFVSADATLNATAPSDVGVYIHLIRIEGAFEYDVEFPILVGRHATIIWDQNYPKIPGV